MVLDHEYSIKISISRAAWLPIRLRLPGDAVSGGRGVLALHGVTSSPPPHSGGAADRLVLTQLIHAGLSGHVEPHGLLVVDVDALSGRHVTLVGGEGLNHSCVISF